MRAYWQVSLERLQLRPGWQTSLGQQRWPTSPHWAQELLRQSVHAAVHSTPLPQQVWPAWPQVPPWQPLLVHTPWPPGQVAPAAMQVVLFWSQQPPPLHTLPPQHRCPGPPHWVQVLFAHTVPSEQVSLLQQGWPAPPHCAQTLPGPQPNAAPRQVSPAQQGCPTSPQRAQVVPLQPMPEAVQRLPQHAWPSPPQEPQLPVAQVPKPGQVLPVATHWALTQHPPPAQLLAAQQRWPGPPHWAHSPLLHTPSVTHSTAPEQHACPSPPQFTPGAHWQLDAAAAATAVARDNLHQKAFELPARTDIAFSMFLD